MALYWIVMLLVFCKTIESSDQKLKEEGETEYYEQDIRFNFESEAAKINQCNNYLWSLITEVENADGKVLTE